MKLDWVDLPDGRRWRWQKDGVKGTYFIHHDPTDETGNPWVLTFEPTAPEGGDMTDNPWEDPGWLEYAEHAINELVPKMRDSAIVMSLLPDARETRKTDVKFAVELGFSIMMDKPIIAVVTPGTPIPAKMVAIADEIVEGTMDDPDFQKRMVAAIERVKTRLENEDGQRRQGGHG